MESIAADAGAEIVALADPDADLLAAAARLAPEAARLSSLEELLALAAGWRGDREPERVACGANDRRSPQRAGRVLPEAARPPRRRSPGDRGRRASRRIGCSGSIFPTGTWRGCVRMRELLRGGELGEVFAVDLVFHNAYGPQKPWFYDRQLSGGGCVIDLGIHLVDAAMWALQSRVRGGLGLRLCEGPAARAGRRCGGRLRHRAARAGERRGRESRLLVASARRPARGHRGGFLRHGRRSGAAQSRRLVHGVRDAALPRHQRGDDRRPARGLGRPGRGRVGAQAGGEPAASIAEIERQIHVAQTLDAIYGRATPSP